MTTSNGASARSDDNRPAFLGAITQDYEEPRWAGGSGPRQFVPPAAVQGVFDVGISRLRDRVASNVVQHSVEVAVARVKLRADAIAKSHRHPALMDRITVAGIEQPGEILGVMTPMTIQALSEVVAHGSQSQLRQLSAVEDVAPFEPKVQAGERRSIVTLLDGRLDDGSGLRETGIERLTVGGADLTSYGRSTDKFVAQHLPPEAVLAQMPWIRRVRPEGQVVPLAVLGTNPVLSQRLPSSPGPLPRPIVGIIDSGIDASNPWLDRLVVAREHSFPTALSDDTHGTLVAALAATGGGFGLPNDPYPDPVARLIDIQVLGDTNMVATGEAELIDRIEDAVERYGPLSTARPANVDQPVRIWNLSLGMDAPCEEADFSAVAQELDRIAKVHGVLFVIAAGNYVDPPLRGWTIGIGPDPIPGGLDRISPPGDAALGMTVGSISDTSNPPSAVPADYPSPFSRRGPGAGMLVKPDVVHYGGTAGLNRERVSGIRGPVLNGSQLEDVGTSVAAPRVTARIAAAEDVLSNPQPELLKLLTLLSCESRGDHVVDRRDSVNYYGFGMVNTPASLLACQPWECTIILEGELRPSYPRRITFPFPDVLTSGGIRRGHIRMALVYPPELDQSRGSEYCQTNVTASLGRQLVNPKTGEVRYHRDVLPIPMSGTGTQLERDLIEHAWKWSPVKLYERTIRRMRVLPNEVGWRLSLDLLLRRELEPDRAQVRQPFWLAIHIADPDRSAQVYDELSAKLTVSGLAQPIQVRTRVRAS